MRQIEDIKIELVELGANLFDILLPETRALLDYIHDDEIINGVVYGQYKKNNIAEGSGRGLLVATDRRILLIDKKPMFLKFDEFSYEIIGGVSYSNVGTSGTVVLQSRNGDISIQTYNSKCAKNFIKAIESKTLNNPT